MAMTTTRDDGGGDERAVVLGEAIGGISGIEELALMFAVGARDAAAALMNHGDLGRQRLQAAENLESLAASDAGSQAALTTADDAYNELLGSKTERTFPGPAKAAFGAAAVAAVVAIAGVSIGNTAVIAVAVLAAVGAAAFGMMKRNAATQAYDDEVATAQTALEHCENRVSAVRDELKQIKTALAGLDSELAGFDAGRTVAVVGRLYYPVRTVNMAGYNLLMDSVGLTPSVDLEIPDLAAQPDVIERVTATIARTANLPVLLAPSEERSAALDVLHGEELELKEALNEFSTMVTEIPVHRRRLPIVRNDTRLARLIENVDRQPAQDILEGAVLRSSHAKQTVQAISDLTAVADRLRRVGGRADAVLRDTHQQLERNLSAYEQSRDHALNILHSEFIDAMGRSALLSVKCYCPKCNRVPDYLYLKLGVPLEEAHLDDQRQLFSRLNDDDEIARRLESNGQLVEDLNRAYHAWGILAAGATEAAQSNQQSDDASANDVVDLGQWQANLARLRALQNQADVVLEEYRSVLRAMVTGHARPLLEMAREARLLLDPVHETWTCATCGTCFSDPDIVEMGRLLKVKDELMMPIWNHLWTEQDNFRKSELFRTNEAVQRMGEKESEKLMSLSESYKADMRPVRENIIRYTAEAANKQGQLVDTIDGLVDMGLMTEEKGAEVRGRLGELMQGSLSETKRTAEAKELMLSLEPQAQLARRPDADDPINLLLTPKTLFAEFDPDVLLSIEAAGSMEQVSEPQLLANDGAPPQGAGDV